MATAKYLGIFMDHSRANLIEFTEEQDLIKTIESEFTHEEKELSMSKGENRMHNKEQQMQLEYYKALGEEILNYQKVILFGPTDAKIELYNLLKEDNKFKNIMLDSASTDKLSENQQFAFVKKYFQKHLFTIL